MNMVGKHKILWKYLLSVFPSVMIFQFHHTNLIWCYLCISRAYLACCVLAKLLSFRPACNLVAGSNFHSRLLFPGFEKDMFKLKNEKQAMEQEAYLWSVSDMWAQMLFLTRGLLWSKGRTNEDLSHDFLFLTPNDIISDAVLVAWI
jgi:hypothetical protein